MDNIFHFIRWCWWCEEYICIRISKMIGVISSSWIFLMLYFFPINMKKFLKLSAMLNLSVMVCPLISSDDEEKVSFFFLEYIILWMLSQRVLQFFFFKIFLISFIFLDFSLAIHFFIASFYNCNSFRQGQISMIDKFAWNFWYLTEQEIAIEKPCIYQSNCVKLLQSIIHK